MNKEQIIKIFKNKNNRIIFIIFIIGVVLVLTAQNHKDTGGESAYTPTSAVSVRDEEERLAEMLAQIEGAGRVSVMITYESGTEKSLAYETRTSSREDSGEKSEDRKAVTSGGEPMVVKEVYPQVKGVIVAADGADSASVKTAIREAVTASLGVSAHRVCIFKKEE